MSSATILSEPRGTVDDPAPASSAAPDGTTPPRGAARDPWLDNARFAAAALILVLHFARRVPGDSTAVDLLNFGTWPMRLPVYVLIAGFFSSAAPLRAAEPWRCCATSCSCTSPSRCSRPSTRGPSRGT